MSLKQLSTKGFLLKQVPLANDDVLLVFLTDTHGLIKVFGTKLQRSKQKRAELDYFRLLDLELSRPKETFKLRRVRSVQDFSANWQTYDQSAFAFSTLEACAHFCPEEKLMPEVLSLLPIVWTQLQDDLTLWSVFFNIKLLWHSGVLPRFDGIREDCYVDPLTLGFYAKPVVGALGMVNHERQVLEFIRRSDAETVRRSQEKFGLETLQSLQHFLQQVLKNH